jgi:hypothetical protein
VLEYILEDEKLTSILRSMDVKKYGLFLLQGYIDKNKAMRKVSEDII